MESAVISSVDTDLDHPATLELENYGRKSEGEILKEHKKSLQKNHAFLLEHLDLNLLLPSLYSKGVLNHSDYKECRDKIDCGRSNDATIHFLLKLTHHKSFDDFFWFCETVIIQQRAPWICHRLLQEKDWKTLNGLRERRHLKEHGNLNTFTKIPQNATPEQVADFTAEMAHLEEMWNAMPREPAAQPGPLFAGPEEETILKQAVATESLCESERPMEVVPMQTSDTDPAHSGALEERGSIEPDGICDDAVASLDPEWVQNLRHYQRELAQPGVRGQNYIVTAPTGSGKTHVAGYVIYEHLKRLGDKGRVVFFCPEVELVDQQYEKIEEWFGEKYNTDSLVGSRVADSLAIEEMVKGSEIVVVTPAIVDNALAQGKIASLAAFTLMIFDECHHTDGNHPYNKIMSKYLDAKLNKEKIKLPQVMGMTASLGVKKAVSNDDAVLFVQHRCANMDAHQITVVREHTEELAEFSNDPIESTLIVEDRSDDEFQRIMVETMKKVELKVKSTLAKATLLDSKVFLEFPNKKHSDIYRATLADTKNKLSDLSADGHERLIVLPCIEYLMSFSWCLDMHKLARAQDALVILKRKLDSRPRGQVDEQNKPEIEKWLEGQVQAILPRLHELAPTLVNPRLVQLKHIITAQYTENPESRCILFTKTRLSTEAIKGWINEDPDMAHLNAERITGKATQDLSAITNSKQEQVLQDFRDGKHKILVATSVAEEGLDIQACNMVVKYEYDTNEIGRVQTRGRARQQESKIVNVATPEAKGKEKLNLFREGLMKSAVRKIQAMTRKTYQHTIQSFQINDCRDRIYAKRMKEQLLKNKSTARFIVACFGCKRHICYSDEVRKFQDSWHVCINPGFKDLINIERLSKKTKGFDHFIPQSVATCSNPGCRLYLADIFSYKEQVFFPALKGNAFMMFSTKADGSRNQKVPKFKKWEQSPCRFETITEADFLHTFQGKLYQGEF